MDPLNGGLNGVKDIIAGDGQLDNGDVGLVVPNLTGGITASDDDITGLVDRDVSIAKLKIAAHNRDGFM